MTVFSEWFLKYNEYLLQYYILSNIKQANMYIVSITLYTYYWPWYIKTDKSNECAQQSCVGDPWSVVFA